MPQPQPSDTPTASSRPRHRRPRRLVAVCAVVLLGAVGAVTGLRASFAAGGISAADIDAAATAYQAARRLNAPAAPTPSPSAPPGATTVPAPTTPPVAGGFPSASTTGVPAGVTLSPSGSLTITRAGTVVDSLNISGTVNINASNVTLRRSRVTGSGFALVNIRSGLTNVIIEDVEIDGRGASGTENSMGVYGPAKVLRSNIHGVENGVTPFSGSEVRDNYIHSLAAPGAPHYDGIQIDGGVSNVVVDHNTIDLSEHDQTSAVMVDNYFGPVRNVTISNNSLAGGGYTVYCDGQFTGGTIEAVAFTGNRIARGHYGYALIRNCSPTWTGNTDPSGATIRRPS